MVVAAHAGIHKLDIDVLADTLDVAVVPGLKGKGRRFAAAFFHGALVGAAAGMRFDAVRLAVGDVHVPAIGLPTRLAGGKMLVGISDSAVVLFAKFVLGRIGIGIAPPPEILDEVVPLLIVRQTLERLEFLVGDDPAHILIDPFLVWPLEFVPQLLLLFELFFIAQRTLKRVLGLGIRRCVGTCSRSTGLRRRRRLRDDYGTAGPTTRAEKGWN